MISSFDVATIILDNCSINEEKRRNIKDICSNIDGILKQNEDFGFDVNINDNEVIIGIVVPL